MVIYTRTGDEGKTSLRGGSRVSKGGLLMSVLGTIDELNSQLGLVAALLYSFERLVEDDEARTHLELFRGKLYLVQSDLLYLGAGLADGKRNIEQGQTQEQIDNQSHLRSAMQVIESQVAVVPRENGAVGTVNWDGMVKEIESWIDELDKELPTLRNFVLPGGSIGAAQLMVARTICRRAERELVRYVSVQEKQSSRKDGARNVDAMPVLQGGMKYLNRLSDWLFVCSRGVNWVLKAEEQVWRG